MTAFDQLAPNNYAVWLRHFSSKLSVWIIGSQASTLRDVFAHLLMRRISYANGKVDV